MKKQKPTRTRRSNLELLGGVPTEALEALRKTAKEADLPLVRVFRDALEIGLSVVADPEESPYAGLITFRNTLKSKALTRDGTERPRLPTGERSGAIRETTEAIGPGSPYYDAGAGDMGEALDAESSRDVATIAEGPIAEGSDNAGERSRQWPETQEGHEVLSAGGGRDLEAP